MKQYKIKCTPGEWSIRYLPDGTPFVEAPKLDRKHGYNISILQEDGNYPLEYLIADAHLISASKDLFKALSMFVECHLKPTNTDEYREAYDLSIAALKKATTIKTAPANRDK